MCPLIFSVSMHRNVLYAAKSSEASFSAQAKKKVYIHRMLQPLFHPPHNILALPPQIYSSQVKIYSFRNAYAKFNFFIFQIN